MQEEQLTIVDVREQQEFDAEHVPGALHIPLNEVEVRMDELNKDETIYLICQTGRRSGIASIQLAENGFDNVLNVVPGMSDWAKQTTKRGYES